MCEQSEGPHYIVASFVRSDLSLVLYYRLLDSTRFLEVDSRKDFASAFRGFKGMWILYGHACQSDNSMWVLHGITCNQGKNTKNTRVYGEIGLCAQNVSANKFNEWVVR